MSVKRRFNAGVEVSKTNRLLCTSVYIQASLRWFQTKVQSSEGKIDRNNNIDIWIDKHFLFLQEDLIDSFTAGESTLREVISDPKELTDLIQLKEISEQQAKRTVS